MLKRQDNLIVSDMYRKALERKKKQERGEKVEKTGVGDVIGVDVPYEEPENPELVIESEKITPEEGASLIYRMIFI